LDGVELGRRGAGLPLIEVEPDTLGRHDCRDLEAVVAEGVLESKPDPIAGQPDGLEVDGELVE
jgi:hypothetical protein